MSASTLRPPRLSIVIPAADAAAFEDTLVSVLENRPEDCEIVAALGMPYDDPWSIGEEVRIVRAPTGTGLVGCVNLGAASSRGEVIHILAGGWRATEGWTDAAVARFADPTVAAVVPVGLASEDRGRLVAAGIRRTAGGRSLVNAPPRAGERVEDFQPDMVAAPGSPALEAGFWRSDVLAAGGFTTACGDDLAAADMAATLTCSGERVVLEPASRVVWAAATKQPAPLVAGLHAERLFWRSLPAHSPVPALAAHAAEVVRHAAATAPLGTVPMLVGRLLALVQFGSCLPRAKELRRLLAGAARPAIVDGGQVPDTLRIDAGHALPSRPRRAGGVGLGSRPEPGGGDSPLRRSA